MQPSTETIQTPPTQPRPTRGGTPTPPSRGAPDRFGNALTQALVPSVPAATVKPAETTPAVPVSVTLPIEVASTLPSMLLPTKAAVAVAADKPITMAVAADKPIKDEPASPVAGPKQDEPSIEAGKTLNVAQPLPQAQPGLPAPFQALPAAPSTIGTPPGVTESLAPAAPDAPPPIAIGSVDCQPPAVPVAITAQPATQPLPASIPPAHAASLSGAGATAGQTVPGQPAAALSEDKPLADLLSIAADPVAASPVAQPSPLTAAPPANAPPHHASVPPAVASRPSMPGEPPASVASQVGPALASFAASAAHSGAPQNMVIRLDPMELGRVQVRIERSPDGSARVDLVVERPDTLLLLLRDQPHLHRALDLAGVPSADRTLQFHLTPPGAPTPSAMTPQSSAEHGPGQQRPGPQRSNRPPHSGTVFTLDDPITRPLASRRPGVDITA